MVRLHELSLGDTFEDLLVEVYQLEGVDPGSKPRDPVYSALVRDPSGYCRLIYRANNNCKPTSVKRGKFYRISGKVSSYRGRMQIQVGSSWGRVEKVNGDEFVCNLSYSPATDLSAVERWYGALVVHAACVDMAVAASDGCQTHRLRAYILPVSRRQQHQQHQKAAGCGGAAAGLLPMPPTPVPCTTASYVETERAAAHRALREMLRVAPDVVRILPLPPVLHIQPATNPPSTGGSSNNKNNSNTSSTSDGGSDVAAPAFWHIFAAVLQCPDEDLKHVFGEPRGGVWVDLEELAAEVAAEVAAGSAGTSGGRGGSNERAPVAWRAPLAQLVTMASTAQAAGLLELHLPPQGSSSTAAAAQSQATTLAEPPSAAPLTKPVQASEAGEAPPPAAAVACRGGGGKEEEEQEEGRRRRLPVTLLSGFLGAGKTTLLRHILTNRERDMRCAVVVNDMAELNIDAALVGHGSLAAATASTAAATARGGRQAGGSAAAVVAAAPERLVELHNGCICCTLRGDLVQQIAEIAADGRFDYCVVESTGIGEPMQVAETFEFPLDGSDPAAALALEVAAAAAAATGAAAPPGGPRRLADVARLDTCVTVVDAANLLDNLNSLETLKDRQESQKVHAHGGGRRNKKNPTAAAADQADAAAATYDDVEELEEEHEDEDDEELERNVADLLLDQLEFADVILLNKVDMVPPAQLPRLTALVGAINPSARLLPTTHSEVPLKEVLNTGRFSLERAREGAGWLKAIREGTDLVPETAEYGITSFVWRSRRPFHPARLHSLIDKYFVLQQPDWSMADGGGGGGSTSSGGDGGGDAQGFAQALPALSGQATHGAEAAGGAGTANFGLGGNVAMAAAKAQEAAAVLAGAFRGFDVGEGSTGMYLDAALHAAAGAAAAAVSAAASAAAAAAAAAGAAAAAAAAVTATAAPSIARTCNAQPQPAARAGSGNTVTAAGFSAAAADPAAVGAAKGAARTAAFGQVLRSKGFAWLAGRDAHVGEWSSAGNLIRFGTGGPWYDVLPREAWPSEPDKVADIEKDFLPGIGDRRQELVFIGIDMLRDQLLAELEACLATPQEEDEIRKAVVAAATAGRCGGGPSALDPFLPWPDIQEIMGAGGDEEEGDGDEEEGEAEEGSFEEEGNEDDGPVGRWEPGAVLEDFTEGAAELQRLLDETEQPAVVVLWRAPWAAASREAEAGLAALAVRHPQLVFVQLDVTASQANEALAVGGCRLMVLPTSRRSDARPTLRDGSKWPALTLHVPPGPGLQYEAYFAGPTALADLRAELLRRQAAWRDTDGATATATTATATTSAPSAAVAAAAAVTAPLLPPPPLLRRRPTTQLVPATPAKPTVSTGAITTTTLASSTSSACSSHHHHHSHSNPQQQQQRSQPPPHPRLVELRRGATDLKTHLQEARDASCPVVVAWLSAPPPNYPSTPTASVPSSSAAAGGGGSGSGAAIGTLATPPPPAARRSTVQHPIPPPSSYSSQDGGTMRLEVLELSEQEQATLRVDIAAVCMSYGGPVRVLFADPGVSAANRALAEALRVAMAPTLQVYADMKMVKSLKGPAAVGKLAATLEDVSPPAPPPLPPHPPGPPSAAAAASASAAVSSQSLEASPSMTPGLPVGTTTATTAASEQPSALQPQAAQPSIYDPPTGKYAKPGMRKQFGPRGRGVYWPRMPCLRCGCPWWLGEDWDAECVRCGWDCEADGYDDDSNPLPAFKAKYDTFTAALREGRTAVWKGKHVGPRG